ncbi:MAG: tetratricopeptide repeat protein [Microscillaceae bacterium]|nr:tetratricopeptide repeat protein [Microscillaceae bacterium]MDW8460576.1 tetratricopeptide repeat protein [Cytophagales bacterium]
MRQGYKPQLSVRLFPIIWCLCASQWAGFAQTQTKASRIVSLENQLLTAPKDTNKIILLYQLSQLYFSNARPKAIEYAQQSIALARDLENEKYLALGLSHLAYLNLYQANNEQAITTIQEAYILYQQLVQKEQVADCLNLMAWIHADKNPNKTDEYLRQARIVNEDANYPKGMIDTEWVEAKRLTLQNKHEEALEKYLKVIAFYEKNPYKDFLGNSTHYCQRLANLYEQVAETYEKKGDWDNAIAYYQKTLPQYENLEDRANLAKSLMTIGQTYQDKKNENSKALEYYFQAFIALKDRTIENDLVQAIEPLEKIVKSFNNLKELAQQNNDKSKQQEYQKLAEAYTQKLNQAKNIKKLANAQAIDKNQEANLSDSQRIALLNLEKQKLALENLAKNKRISYLEMLQAKARLQQQEDSIRLLQKDILIADLQKEKKERILQINSLKAAQNAQILEAQQRQNIQWIWITALAALFILLAFWFFRKHLRNQKIIDYHKNKLLLSTQRISRQETEIREQKELINQKDKQLAQTISQLDEAKQQHLAMTQMIAEDLQTPLSNLVEISENEPLNRPLVHETSKQLLQWVTDILDVNKLDHQPKIHIFKENLSVYKTIKKAIETYDTLLREKQIYVENNVKSFYYAQYDRQILEKVILNFISNTIKYAPPKGAILKFDAIPVKENEQDFLKISIEDNGAVIPENLIPLVFEKFPPEEARPLGLSLVYNKLMIEAHGGKVSVSSHKELGTTFYFTLLEAKSMEDLDYKTILFSEIEAGKKRTEQELAEDFRNKLELLERTISTEIPTTAKEEQSTTQETQVPKRELDLTNIDDLVMAFKPEHKEYLKPFLFELASLEYYEITAIKALISKVQSDDKVIIAWKRAVEQAIYYLDEKKFNKLARI